MSTFAAIQELEERTQGRVLVFAASSLDIDLLPPVYEALRGIGHSAHLSIVIYCRGGAVNTARRLALLLHKHTDHLRFIVPHFCESAATVMALAAREIIAGPLAIFSPIDPHLTASNNAQDSAPPALSAQDVRLFWEMAQDWFGLDEQAAKDRALPLLCDNIFPTTLTSFHRCTRELQCIGEALLALHMSDRPAAVRAQIVNTLLFDYHSHTYALTGEDMQQIGLPVRHDAAIEDAAWTLSCAIRANIGPESRDSFEHDWYDAMLLTREGGQRRRRKHNVPSGIWERFETP